jgi:hypothetical protein
MNKRLVAATILTVFMPFWGYEVSKIDSGLPGLFGFLGYVMLIAALIATAHRSRA